MAITWQSWMGRLWSGLWNPEKGLQRDGPIGHENASMQPVSDGRAMQIAAVFRSIRIIAETCSSLPLVGFQKLANGDLQPLPDSHWLPNLINYPNPTMTGDEWREAMYAQMAGWGNGYSQMVRQSEGRVAELWPYKVANMLVDRLENRMLEYRYPDTNGTEQRLSAGKVLHLRAFSPDGVMGLSPLALARESMGLAIGAERYAASFYAQGGRPSGVMTSDVVLNEKQREQIRREYGGLAEGGNDKRFWLLEGPLKYQPITVNPEDMQMLQTRSFQIADISRWFGVPLFLLSETEKSTSWGTGLEQQNLAFLIYTLRAYLARMEATFNRYIIPDTERGRLVVAVDDSPLLMADKSVLKDFFSSMVQNGIMDRNEVRQRLRLSQRTEAGALTAQVNLAPLDRLGRLPAQPGLPPVP